MADHFVKEGCCFFMKTPLRLASGEEITLVKQTSKDMDPFRTEFVNESEDAHYFNFIFREHATAAYENLLPRNYSFMLIATHHLNYRHVSYVSRKYGQWWTKAPSRLKNFGRTNDDSTTNHDFVEIEFLEEVYPVRISVIELLNPGSIITIWAKNNNKEWIQLWHGLPQRLPDKQRIFSPPLRNCNFKTKVFRFEFDHSVLNWFALISAVFLVGTSQLIAFNDEFGTRSLCDFLESNKNSDVDTDDPSNLTAHLSAETLIDALLKFDEILRNSILYKSKITRKIPEKNASPVLRIHESIDETELTSTSSTELTSNFDDLSDEILLKIFKFLDLRSLCRCSQVNERFRNVTQDPFLYTCLNLAPYWYSLNDAVLNSLSSRCQYLQCLDLSWIGNNDTITPNEFNVFVKICGRYLTDLRLHYCHFVDDSVINEISSTCSNLKELIFRSRKVTDNGFKYLESLKSLERLDICAWYIKDSTLCSIIRKNRNMRHLNLAEWSRKDFDADKVTMVIAESWPNLESLQWPGTNVSSKGIQELARCVQLREIGFGHAHAMFINDDECSSSSPSSSSSQSNRFRPNMYNLQARSVSEDFEDDESGSVYGVRTLFTYCVLLEKIDVTGVFYVRDKDLEPLLCRPIKQLHLGGNGDITVEMLSRLFSSCRQLELIDLNMCGNVEFSDILKWRKLYPHISIKYSDVNMHRP